MFSLLALEKCLFPEDYIGACISLNKPLQTPIQCLSASTTKTRKMIFPSFSDGSFVLLSNHSCLFSFLLTIQDILHPETLALVVERAEPFFFLVKAKLKNFLHLYLSSCCPLHVFHRYNNRIMLDSTLCCAEFLFSNRNAVFIHFIICNRFNLAVVGFLLHYSQ